MTDETGQPWGPDLAKSWNAMNPEMRENVLQAVKRRRGGRGYGVGFTSLMAHRVWSDLDPSVMDDLYTHWRAWWTHRGVLSRAAEPRRRFKRL